MLNPIVQKAMEALTSRIGAQSNLGGPGDEEAAAGILAQLHEAGERFEPEALAAWASLNGWSPKGVARIRSVAADVLIGKSFGGSPGAWHADIVEKLRSESGVERGR